jgi:WD40 repeat protein
VACSPEAENVVRQSLLLLPKPVAQFTHDGYTVVRIVFSRDGRLLATASRDGAARIFDLRSTKEIRSFKSPSPLLMVDLDASGSRVLTAAEDQKLRVFSIETGQELRDWDVQDKNAFASISPDGEYVAAGTHPGDARLFSVGSGEVVWSAHQSEPVLFAAFNTRGDSCVFAAQNGVVTKISLPTRRATSFTGLYSVATQLALSGDGNWLASGTVDGRVRLHRLDTGAQQLAVTYGSPVVALAVDTAGEHIRIRFAPESS